MKLLLTSLLFIWISSFSFGSTIHSRCDGYWMDTTIWDGAIVPVAGDSIYIHHMLRFSATLNLNSNYLNVLPGAQLCGAYACNVYSGSLVIVNGGAKFATLNIWGNVIINGSMFTNSINNSGSLTVNGSVCIGCSLGCAAFTTSCYQPVAGFSVSNNTICVGECIDFIDNSTNIPTGWSWQFPGALTSNSALQNPSGICYPNPGVYDVTHVAGNVNGNDTITMMQTITVLPNSVGDTSVINCNHYISPTGDDWWNSGIYLDTLSNAIGCDSIVTFHVTIMNSPTVFNETACEIYTTSSGDHSWTISGTYFDTIPNASNCDSIVVYNITILDCSNINNEPLDLIKVYPNPASNLLTFLSPVELNNSALCIYNVIGQSVLTMNASITKGENYSIDISSLRAGTYVLMVNNYPVHFIKE